MYKLHLILKYLRKRRIAWVSLVAVMLCTTMVLVVISVMGGWLRMFRQSFHGLSGDVVVQGKSLTGFPYYQQMIDRIDGLPGVAAAVPTIHTYGLININNQIREGVQVIGYPDDIPRVNDFAKSLHFGAKEAEKAGKISFALHPDVPYAELLPGKNKDAANRPGMIAGASLIGVKKDENNELTGPTDDTITSAFAILTLIQVNADSATPDLSRDKAVQPFWLVDYSRTSVWQYDSQTVYVPFAVLQKNLGMEAFEGSPPRTSDIEIRVKPGADLNAVRDAVKRVVDDVVAANDIPAGYPIEVQTWEETQKLWLGAIEKEKALTTFLFSLISVVAVFLIFCIFYMIVMEKTRDIGIIKSCGATSSGVAAVFLGYGLAIGIVGGGLGLGAGYLIIHNINELHQWMGKVMGIRIWDPQVYAFDTIPNTMNPREVTVIVGVAIISSVAGALVPAIRAARMNPVEALRWE